MYIHYKLFFFVLLLISCKKQEITRFTLLDPGKTNISFINQLPYTEEYNTYTYRNFYNGGGVALGDINNDGLLDIYFTGNLVDNKLYLNKGNWNFEDITETAGVACKNVWSTGATMVDINGDNLMDIYVCKGGKPGGENRHNELFINQGNLTFKESAKEYGLDVTGLSIQAAFFDFDRDGDLDCYLLNNSIRSIGGFDLIENQRNIYDAEGNKFFRNDNGYFNDITQEAGIYSSSIGYGLGITLSDYNLDGYTDIFLSNDFFERDYLYFNLKNGKFSERGDISFHSMSMGSMGADAADLNNDLLPDLFVTEMLPKSLQRKKTKNIYESWDKYRNGVEKGYHHQYSRNVLQRNIGNGDFLEIGRFAGVAATEWSWSALIQDFDNDGLKDIFVSNGQFKDLLDRDYLNFYANENRIKKGIANKEKVIMNLIDSMPSEAVSNFMFNNKSQFQFQDVTSTWGLDQASFSNGSAYGDLDNDGDLDLVVNNVNMPSFVYRNNTDTTINRSIQFKLIGENKNTSAIGTKVILKDNGKTQMVEHFSAKGFQSSINDKIHFGVGNEKVIDTIDIIWPNGNKTSLLNLKTNSIYTVDQKTHKGIAYAEKTIEDITGEIDPQIKFKHKDLEINLFTRERLLLEMNGFDGPALAVADINGDGIDDVFCGGGKNQNSSLFLSQKIKDKYSEIQEPFEEDVKSEKVNAKFFDSDNDGDLDLYVAHGGKAFSQMANELNDVLYINDGKGNLTKNETFTKFTYTFSTGDFTIIDVNKDGWNDVVVTEKMKTDFYGLKGNVFVLINQKNNQYTCEMINALKDVGMISSIDNLDFDKDGWTDIVIAGKWMPITVFYNDKALFKGRKYEIENSTGLWNTIKAEDIDDDKDLDLIVGNEGLNTFYKVDDILLVSDFDKNGTIEQLVFQKDSEKYFPIHDVDEIFSQLPYLKKKYLYYKNFAKADMNAIFSKTQLQDAQQYTLSELKSRIYKNENSTFMPIELPLEVQYSSVHAIYYETKTNNLLLGGNHYKVKPQFGRQDASMAWALKLNKDLDLQKIRPKPLHIKGQIRAIEIFNNNYIFGINNEALKFYRVNR